MKTDRKWRENQLNAVAAVPQRQRGEEVAPKLEPPADPRSEVWDLGP